MFSWPWSKKEAKPSVPPPPAPTVAPPAPPPVQPIPSPVSERAARLPPLPFAEEPPAPRPASELDSLRASIEASIAQRSDERVVEQLPLDLKASSPFHSADGGHYMTLRDFANALLVMDERTFSHHVTAHKNDFANWMEHCFDDKTKKIAHLLRGKSRQEMARLLNYALQPPLQRKEVTPQPIDMTPLPPSPLHETPEQRVHTIIDSIHVIESQAQADPVAAKDAFIALRTRIWQDLSEDERKQVLPQLRSLYERIRYTR